MGSNPTLPTMFLEIEMLSITTGLDPVSTLIKQVKDLEERVKLLEQQQKQSDQNR